jgi:hypothetical protein
MVAGERTEATHMGAKGEWPLYSLFMLKGKQSVEDLGENL